MSPKLTAGFTLLELIIVMSILTVMIGGAMYVISTGQETFDEGATTGYLESQVARLIDMMKDDITECLVLTTTPFSAPTTSNNYASISIKVPVSVSGSYWDATSGSVNWGANGNANWYYTYTFSYVKTLSEATDQLDYNRDGDISDSFDIGRMVKNVYNSSGTLQSSNVLCDDIITVATTRYLDIDGNGNSDPIFIFCDKEGEAVTSGGVGVRVNIWLGGKLGAKQSPIIINTNTAMLLMNPQ